jgi:hypothetical protein
MGRFQPTSPFDPAVIALFARPDRGQAKFHLFEHTFDLAESKESIMAAKTTTIKDIETVEQAEAAELLDIVSAGIVQLIEAHGIDIQKSRYKAMRAIAWQAFVESIEAGEFDALVQRASANVGALPSGWEIKVPEKAPAKSVAETAPVQAPVRKRVAPKS